MEKWKHPELQEGEILVGNETEKHFEESEWKTKRMGEVPYDIYGNIVEEDEEDFNMPHVYPMFIQRSEVEQMIERREKEGKDIKIYEEMLE